MNGRLALLSLLTMVTAGVVYLPPMVAQSVPSGLEESDLDPEPLPAEGEGLAAGLEEWPEESVEGMRFERVTLTPWSVTVLGRGYENFSNDEASLVLNNWLTNALMTVPIFNVVNRDKMNATLSEHQLVAVGYAEEVPTVALASAGRLLKLSYILFGNFTNLGGTTEVDFKLLDVATTTYPVTLNFTIPFNTSLETMKVEVERVVAALAAKFPVITEIAEILPGNRLVVPVGTLAGVIPDTEVAVWSRRGRQAVASGYVVTAGQRAAEIQLEDPVLGLDLFDHEVRITIVPPAQAALSRGLRELEMGRLHQAEASFLRGLALAPDDGVLLERLARTHLALGSYSSAVSAFRRAVELRPDDLELLEGAVTGYLAAGQLQDAVEELERESRYRRSARLALLHGSAAELRGDLDEAREGYRLSSRLSPTDWQAHLNLAIVAVKRGELDEARRELRQAAALTRGAPPAALSLAQAALGSILDGATNLVPEALVEQAIAAGDCAAVVGAGDILIRDERTRGEGLALAQGCLAERPGYFPAALLAVRAHAASGEIGEALSAVNRALDASPHNSALLMLSAELLEMEGNVLGAEGRLRQARDLSTTDWLAPRRLGALYLAQGDFLQAASELAVALERAEHRGVGDRAELLHDLGTALLQARQYTTAQPHFERCVAIAPHHHRCHFGLGLCAVEAGTAAGDQLALRAFRAAEGIAERWYHLGALYDRLGDVEAALDAHRACVEASCSQATESQERIDAIETITGTITDVKPIQKRVTLDVGSIHGVSHGKEAIVIGSEGSFRLAVLRIVEVSERSSVGALVRGEPLVGQTVRFRPSRPRGLAASPGQRRGVDLRWDRAREPEVTSYVIHRYDGAFWRVIRERYRDTSYSDRAARAGTFRYRVEAVATHGARSLPSVEVEITVE